MSREEKRKDNEQGRKGKENNSKINKMRGR